MSPQLSDCPVSEFGEILQPFLSSRVCVLSIWILLFLPHRIVNKHLFSLKVVSFVVFLSVFLKELGLFPASWLWFLFVLSPLPYRFVVTLLWVHNTAESTFYSLDFILMKRKCVDDLRCLMRIEVVVQTKCVQQIQRPVVGHTSLSDLKLDEPEMHSTSRGWKNDNRNTAQPLMMELLWAKKWVSTGTPAALNEQIVVQSTFWKNCQVCVDSMHHCVCLLSA